MNDAGYRIEDNGKDFTPTFNYLGFGNIEHVSRSYMRLRCIRSCSSLSRNSSPSRGRREKVPSPQRGGRSGWGGIISSRARALRKNPTDAENKLWLHLRLRQIEGYKFRRQQPIGIYIVDFACMEEKLIVELDGGQHNERIDYDSKRTVWLRSQGYRVLRFWNNEVLENIEVVLDVIFRALRK